MTIRQLWVRIWSLLIDPDSLLRRYLAAEADREEAAARVQDLEDLMDGLRPPSARGE